MENKLLPCPFCGGEAECRSGSSTTPYIRCKKCGCRTGSSYNREKLAEAWNTRPTEERAYSEGYEDAVEVCRP